MNLDQYFKEVKVNKTKMAKELGCHRNHLHDISKGKGTPKLKLAIAIMKYTEGKVTIDELICPKDSQENQLNSCPEQEGPLC